MTKLALLLVCLATTRGAASTTITGGNIINQTWTTSGSPYIVEGDVTIPAGSTLTIEAGVVIQLPPGDLQGSSSLDYTSFLVKGSLVVQGTAAAPVTFAGTREGSWGAIEIDSSATSVVLEHVVITNAQTGIMAFGAAQVISASDIDIESPHATGVYVSNANVQFDRLRVTGGMIGIQVSGGTAAVTNCLVTQSTAGGATVGLGGTLSLTNCTLDDTGIGVDVNDTTGTAHVTNCLVTNNTSAGIVSQEPSQVDVTYSDVWHNNLNDYVRASAGTGCISANPQYVSATDYHLQATSVAIDSGTTGPELDLDGNGRPVDGDRLGGAQWDMGAFEYGAMPLGDAGVPNVDAAPGGNPQGDDAGVNAGSEHRGGCCAASDSPGAPALLAVTVALLLGRRRRSASAR